MDVEAIAAAFETFARLIEDHLKHELGDDEYAALYSVADAASETAYKVRQHLIENGEG